MHQFLKLIIKSILLSTLLFSCKDSGSTERSGFNCLIQASLNLEGKSIVIIETENWQKNGESYLMVSSEENVYFSDDYAVSKAYNKDIYLQSGISENGIFINTTQLNHKSLLSDSELIRIDSAKNPNAEEGFRDFPDMLHLIYNKKNDCFKHVNGQRKKYELILKCKICD